MLKLTAERLELSIIFKRHFASYTHTVLFGGRVCWVMTGWWGCGWGSFRCFICCASSRWISSKDFVRTGCLAKLPQPDSLAWGCWACCRACCCCSFRSSWCWRRCYGNIVGIGGTEISLKGNLPNQNQKGCCLGCILPPASVVLSPLPVSGSQQATGHCGPGLQC